MKLECRSPHAQAHPMLVHLQRNINCSLNVVHGLKCYSFSCTETLPRPVSSDAALRCTGSLSLSEQVDSSQLAKGEAEL